MATKIVSDSNSSSSSSGTVSLTISLVGPVIITSTVSSIITKTLGWATGNFRSYKRLIVAGYNRIYYEDI